VSSDKKTSFFIEFSLFSITYLNEIQLRGKTHYQQLSHGHKRRFLVGEVESIEKR
jgi:hypothetical protein